jgi:hypothetical protein
MTTNRRKIGVSVEHRPLAGEVIKPEKMRVDLWAVVEDRSGVTLRWFYTKSDAVAARDRINNGGDI